MDNWFPEQDGLRIRGGSTLHATVDTDHVEALFAYDFGTTQKLFAATDDAIYDITSPADPEVAPSADVSSLTGGDWHFATQSTSGGNFIFGVNGSDSARHYSGITWATPSITGVTSSTLSHVWKFKSRLFMIEDGTMSAWYLGTDAIAGAASERTLGPIFNQGGALYLGATQSSDAGDGMDDRCVFVTTRGEVAVYQGSDPSSASTWALVGVYKMAPPISKRVMGGGGDVFFLTEDGLVPLSAVMNKDPAVLSEVAVSAGIEPTWRDAVSRRGSTVWDIARWDTANMALVAAPKSGAVEAECLVANLETGAWARYTGWDVRRLAVLDKVAYFGTSDGKIYTAETGGSDAGSPYTGIAVGHFDPMGSISEKGVSLVRGAFITSYPLVPKLGATANYAVSLSSAPNSPANVTDSVWDTAVWGTAVWDGAGATEVRTLWQDVAACGFRLAPTLQITSGTNFKPDAVFLGWELIVTQGRDVA